VRTTVKVQPSNPRSAEVPSRREERVNTQAAAASRRDVITERVLRQAQHALSSSKGVVVVAYSEARQAQRSTTGRRPLNRRTAVAAAR
jgi:hypothetical protein